MDIVILISSVVTALSTLAIALLVLQIQKSLHTNKTQQEKLLRFLEEANEVSKDIKRIASEETKQHTEASTTTKKQIENLILESQKIANYINELLQSSGKTNQNIYNLIQETQQLANYLNELRKSNAQDNKNLYNILFDSKNVQLEKLQATVDELRALKASLEESVRF